MKLLIIGDLHGAMPKIRYKDFDAIIVVGDICSDHGIRDAYMHMYKGYVEDVGNYYDWWDLTGKKRAKRYLMNSIHVGKEILRKLDSYGKPVIGVPGNWDWASRSKESWAPMRRNYWKEYIIKGHKNFRDIDGKMLELNGILLIGYGKVNGPELIALRGYGYVPLAEIRQNKRHYKELFKRYDKKFREAKKKGFPIVLLSHNVPHNTRLDTIVDRKNPLNGKHFGSVLAKDLIVKHQPLLSIGGHMHEHYGPVKVGKTICLNTGFGPDVNTLVDIEDGRIKSILYSRKFK